MLHGGLAAMFRFLCRTNEGQGSTRVLLQTTPALWDSLACSPALQAHTWLPSRLQQTHWFCIPGYSVANKHKTAAHQLLVQQIKHKAQTLGSECVTHILSAPGLLHPLQGRIAALQQCSIALLILGAMFSGSGKLQ